MSFFQHQHKTIAYNVHSNIFPHDLMFIHGNLASARWWQPVINQLEIQHESDMRGNVVSVDWLGCGKSSAPKSEADLDMRALAEDHVALARAMGLSDVCLVGHSTGGLVALAAVLQAPELFSKILLLDTVGAKGIRLSDEMLEAFAKMKKDRNFCEAVLMSTVYGVNTKADFYQALVDDAFGVNELIWTGIPKALNSIDLSQELNKISQPVLVLHGKHEIGRAHV